MKINLQGVLLALCERNERIADKKCIQHVWFAWYPVQTSYMEYEWLCKVYRKYTYIGLEQTCWERRYAFPQYQNYNKALIDALKGTE